MCRTIPRTNPRSLSDRKACTLVSFAVLLRPLIVSTCDPVFFESQTRRPWLVEQGFMLLLVLNLLAAFKTLGTLMAVGFFLISVLFGLFLLSTSFPTRLVLAS